MRRPARRVGKLTTRRLTSRATAEAADRGRVLSLPTDGYSSSAFRAACTPEFYAFDRAGRLAYRGRFDESTPRNSARVTGAELRDAKQQLAADLDAMALLAIDEAVCRAAAQIGEQLAVRSLDAIHLASAQRLVIPGLRFVTFDLRQAQAGRSLGFTVLGS